MEITIIKAKISKLQLQHIAQNNYGHMVKGVADLQLKMIALGGEMHADAEQKLLESGAKQEN